MTYITMNNLSQEFSERIDQLQKDGKGELTSFEITASEFVNKIMDVVLYPDLTYLFVDLSSCTFKNGDVFFEL